jgi:peptidoglycan/LPS O-acetylase OafA/YrhL
MSTSLSQFIHVARWLAALTVLIFHVGALFFVLGSVVDAPSRQPPFAWLFWPSYAFAHEAVVVFFVLSGFLVGGSAIEKARSKQPWLRKYVIDRTVRIYIVLLPVLLICGSVDVLSAHFFSDVGVYSASFARDSFDPWLILWNILNLQGIWFPPFGTNQPMWSLGMEYWYYLLFGFMLLPLGGAGSPYSKYFRVVGCLAAASTFIVFASSGSYFLFGFLIWCLGAAAHVVPFTVIRSPRVSLALFVVVSVAVRLAVSETVLLRETVKYAVDLVQAALFANLLLTLRFDKSAGFAFCRSEIHARLAAFSYSLYASHLPFAIAIFTACVHFFGDHWRRAVLSFAYYPIYLLIVAVLVALSYLVSRVSEAHTAEVRNWARRTFLPRAATQTAMLDDRRSATS